MTDVFIITGATATGKTDCAVRIAKKYNGELVSADSRQVYIGLDIISGKDIPAGSKAVLRKTMEFRGIEYPLVTYDLNGIPVWLYDVVSPEKQCSIALYRVLADEVITDIHSRGKLPIIVGGAGLYIDAVVNPPETIHIPNDNVLRARLNTLQVDALQQELGVVDSGKLTKMNNSDKQNPRRLVRAIEAALWRQNSSGASTNFSAVNAYWIGLRVPAETLSARIEKRVRTRWKHGALDEVRKLVHLPFSSPAVSTLGITSIHEYLTGKLTEEDAIASWMRHEVAYAKRQMVWFAPRSNIHWFDSGLVGYTDEVEKLVGEWYTKG